MTARGAPARRGARLGVLCAVLAITASTLFLIRPKIAYADPHAVFYTDRGQEQVFFNVLAALNQADYVEAPGEPAVAIARAIGDFNVSGIQPPPVPPPTITYEKDELGNIRVIHSPPPLPDERLPLPRLRTRAVTPDNGDVYTRELLQRRALAEAQRTELANLICGFRRVLLGTEGARNCLEQTRQHGLNLLSSSGI